MLVKPLYLLDDPAITAGYTDAQRAMLAEFSERGFVVIDLDTPPGDIVADLSREYRGLHRIQDGWRKHPSVRELACKTQVIDALRTLYGRDAFPFQTLNFDSGTEQATHSDTIHFDSVPAGFMAGVWVALEDVDADNGPLHYFPGTHRLPHLTLADAGIRGAGDGYNSYQPHYEPMIRDFVERGGYERAEGYLKRGQALIWAANLLHGGSPIRGAGRTRHSQVTHYYFTDCAYFTPMQSDLNLGRIKRRYPTDIRTNKGVENRYLGNAVQTPLLARTEAWLKRALRPPRKKHS
jgi:ectoine hydroxylase-related dioxygenase (phytanoyl-CoA dioxygenase family)